MQAAVIKKIPIYITILLSLTVLLSYGRAIFAQDFSSGFVAETSLPAGMIVSLQSQQERLVVPANRNNIGNLLGVVVGGSNSLLNLSTQESNVQVVTSGVVDVLVTDDKGEIKAGNHITASEINGIGRLATREDAKIVGTAQADFADPNVRTVTTETGENMEVSVARIPVLIQVGGNPDMIQQETFLPGFVQESANSLAGEPVAPARIIIALVIIVGGIVGSMVLLYGAISSTIISIGRNPLSNKSIYAGLLRMAVVSIGIIFLSATVAYVILVG